MDDEDLNKLAEKIYDKMYQDFGKSIIKKLAWIAVILLFYLGVKIGAVSIGDLGNFK